MLYLGRIYVMGQSAGAHIAACALLEQAIKESDEGQNCPWSLSQIKAYFGLSGGCVLVTLHSHLCVALSFSSEEEMFANSHLLIILVVIIFIGKDF